MSKGRAYEDEILKSLASSDGERHAEFRRRRDDYVYEKVLIGSEPPYLADGWKISSKLKRQIRLSRAKSVDRKFEDKVWKFFYRMGYEDQNKGYNFSVTYKAADGSFCKKQIDIFAKDAETVIIGECKACEDYRPRSLAKDIAEFSGLKKQIANAIRAFYGRDFQPKILWFFFTEKVLWSNAERNKATAEQIKIMTEREIDYFSQLAEHLGRATRFQFLAEYLGGQKIPALKDTKIPAVRGKLGGQVFYSFVSTAEQLLKICFVNHRTLADPLALPTYQRLVKKSRLKAIGKFISEGGFFPTNILINFDSKARFEKKETNEGADVQFGDLYLPDRYKSAWIVDGQHRLYGYSVVDQKFSKQNIAVIAFEGLRREEEANLFVTINHEQSVPRTLLDELDADLKWGSSVPAERLASISARIVQSLTEATGGALFRRVVAQGMRSDDIACLTMPELKGGLVRSQLIGKLAQKRKMYVGGPLAADTDERSVKRATKALGLFFDHIREANAKRWDVGRKGHLCVNVGARALLLLFSAAIASAEEKKRNFDPSNATPEELVNEAIAAMKPVTQYIKLTSDQEFAERFGSKYGSGGPPEYFYELAQIIWENDKSFAPEGLEDYLASKDQNRVAEAQKTIKHIENRVTEIVIEYFRKLHGANFWNYLGTKEMRVKAYERQQEDEPDKQLDIEAYLDFIDKKKIIEKPENWSNLKIYFDIPLKNEKGYAKNLKWMDRLNELRRVVAHPHKRAFRAEDLEFLDWIKYEFDRKMLTTT